MSYRHEPIEMLELEARWLRWRLNEVREELHRRGRRLSSLRIRFTQPSPQGKHCMSPTSGALTLTTVGETATALVQGFDQNGQPMPADFTMPPVSFSIDNTAVASVDASTGTVTAVGDGSAVLSASVTTAEGVSLSAPADVTVGSQPPPPPPTPVLSSIQITFDSPATPAVAAAAAGVDTRSPNEKLNAAVSGAA